MNPDLAQPTTTPLGEIISPCHISDSPPPRIRFYINSEPGGEQLPFLCALSIALFVNPNVTSLYRLYRDRLSKAFLFNPSTEVQRDRSHDLPAYLPKLHELKTLFCPLSNYQCSLHTSYSGREPRRLAVIEAVPALPRFEARRASDCNGSWPQ